MTIGERIRERRKACGISQDELAKAVGYKNRASITKIEKNEADIPQSTVYAIAQKLNTTPQYLMGWTDDYSAIPKPEPAGDNYQLVSIPDHLTAEEMSIIHAYRALNDDDKQFVLTTIQRLQK